MSLPDTRLAVISADLLLPQAVLVGDCSGSRARCRAERAKTYFLRLYERNEEEHTELIEARSVFA